MRALLAYDGSPGSDHAAAMVRSMAWPTETTIRVVAALPSQLQPPVRGSACLTCHRQVSRSRSHPSSDPNSSTWRSDYVRRAGVPRSVSCEAVLPMRSSKTPRPSRLNSSSWVHVGMGRSPPLCWVRYRRKSWIDHRFPSWSPVSQVSRGSCSRSTDRQALATPRTSFERGRSSMTWRCGSSASTLLRRHGLKGSRSSLIHVRTTTSATTRLAPLPTP